MLCQEVTSPEVVFDARAEQPDDAALSRVLGEAMPGWRRILGHIESHDPDLRAEWKFYGKKHGWQVKVLRKRKSVLYLIPGHQHFRAGLALWGKAIDALQATSLPEVFVREELEGEDLPEGKAARVVCDRDADADLVLAPLGPLQELVPDGAGHVRLAAAGQSEQQQVVTALDEAACAQPRQRPPHLQRELVEVEGPEGLRRGRPARHELALEPASAALIHREPHQVVEVGAVDPATLLRAAGDLLPADTCLIATILATPRGTHPASRSWGPGCAWTHVRGRPRVLAISCL